MEHQKVEELKDMLALVIELVDATQTIANEGGISMTDIGSLWNIVERVGPAFRGMNKIPAEITDLDAEECAELIAFIMEEISIEDVKAKLVVDKSLKALKAAYEVYLEVKA